MNRSSTRLLLAAAAMALTGCNGLPDTLNSAANATDGPAGARLDDAGRSKMSSYTEGYNKLLDTFGLRETQKRYVEEEIAGKSPSDSVSITKGWVYQGLATLRTARAMPGGKPDVDAAADTLIAALDKVVKRLDGLDVYYTSKAYREDGLKRGKAEDPLMRAEFEAADEAMARFEALLDRERRVARVAEMAAMKARGDTLGYNNALALQQAEALVDTFDTDADVGNSAKYAQADGHVAALEKTLAEQRAELDRAKAKETPTTRVDVNYGLVVDRLTSAVGEYRDFKQSRDTDDYNSVVESYNDAVGDSNDIG